MDKKFTHVAIRKLTQRQISILASVRGENIYEMVGKWADDSWKAAKREQLVTDAMLQGEKEKEAA